MKCILLKFILNILKNYMKFIMIYHFTILVLKKVHTVNKFSQNTRLKKNINMKTDLRKHRHIKLVTTEKDETIASLYT